MSDSIIVAGIDPGITGALAVLGVDGECDTVAMPVMGDPAIIDGGAVVRWLGERDVQLVVIEFQSGFSPPGRKIGAATGFSLGRTYGQLLGALQASLIPYRVVTPARWKKDLALAGGEGGKERSRRRAIELLPQIAEQFSRKKDEGRAEAALIAWWYVHARQAVKPRTRRVYAKDDQP